jgi:hypothetical protein
MIQMAKAKKKSAAPKKEAGARTIGGKVVKLDGYQKAKSASGATSLHNGDEVATKLVGKDLGDVYELASKATGESVNALKTKYGKLNAGMQRMSLGNRIRGAASAKAKPGKKAKAKAAA